MKPPTRTFLYYIDDPCIEYDLVSHILLNTFIVSHGIRVDTRLYIVSRKHTYMIDGYELRHLYPQESSLRGFSKAIFCRNKLLPGVHIDHSLKSVGDKAALMHPSHNGLSVLDKPPDHYSGFYIILNNPDYFNNMFPTNTPRIHIKIPRGLSISSTITIINYVLDTWYGAVIRRKGEVIVYRAWR